MKYLLPLYFLLTFSNNGIAKKKLESLKTDWPAEYEWKVVHHENKGENSEIVIIPRQETPNTATIIGVMSASKGLKFTFADSIVSYYKQRTDEGSILTVLDISHDSTTLWVLFKVETPKTDRYPEPESDLYYVAQGEYALYDTHVAIKKSSLSSKFVKKWSIILKNSKIAMQQ